MRRYFASKQLTDAERNEVIRQMEESGALDKNCKSCAQFYESLTLDVFAPCHKPSERCQSSKRNHCSCDVCF